MVDKFIAFVYGAKLHFDVVSEKQERLREQSAARQKEERQRQKAVERQKEVERHREVERLKEVERQRELERHRERQRLELLREAERRKQQEMLSELTRERFDEWLGEQQKVGGTEEYNRNRHLPGLFLQANIFVIGVARDAQDFTDLFDRARRILLKRQGLFALLLIDPLGTPAFTTSGSGSR